MPKNPSPAADHGRDGVAEVPGLRAWACDVARVDPDAVAAERPFDAELTFGVDASLGRAAVLLGLLSGQNLDAWPTTRRPRSLSGSPSVPEGAGKRASLVIRRLGGTRPAPPPPKER